MFMPLVFFSATKGNSLKEEWIAYVCREILRVSIKNSILFLCYGTVIYDSVEILPMV